jgi:hypothetical protein
LDTVLRACRPVADAGCKLCFQTGYSPEFVRLVLSALPPDACMFYFAYAHDAMAAGAILADVARLTSGCRSPRRGNP